MGIVGDDLFGQKKSLNGTDYEDDEEGAIVVPSGELLGMDFETIGLQGKYRSLAIPQLVFLPWYMAYRSPENQHCVSTLQSTWQSIMERYCTVL